MPNYFGAINQINAIGLPAATLFPMGSTDSTAIQAMKRGSRRWRGTSEVRTFRSLPDIITIDNRNLPVRWVA